MDLNRSESVPVEFGSGLGQMWPTQVLIGVRSLLYPDVLFNKEIEEI